MLWVLWGFLPFLLYLAFVLRVIRLWNSPLPEVTKGVGSSFAGETSVSFVLAFRNERKHLPALVSALKAQRYSADLLEFLLVDDGSDDGGAEFLRQELASDSRFSVLYSPGRGKKQALRYGFEQANGEVVLTTDADCVPDPLWVATMVAWYRQREADFVFGPVLMQGKRSLFSDFEVSDYMALQLSGGGAALLGQPVFCSAASLGFRRSCYFEVVDRVRGSHLASGDDVFLLHAFKAAHKRIVFVKDAAAVVRTRVSGGLGSYFRQRMRWGGKSVAYRDGAALLLAAVVFLSNFWLLWLSTGAFIGAWSLWWVFLAFGIKSGVDYFLLRAGHRFFGTSYGWGRHLLFSLGYPFLLVMTALGGLIFRPKWK